MISPRDPCAHLATLTHERVSGSVRELYDVADVVVPVSAVAGAIGGYLVAGKEHPIVAPLVGALVSGVLSGFVVFKTGMILEKRGKT